VTPFEPDTVHLLFYEGGMTPLGVHLIFMDRLINVLYSTLCTLKKEIKYSG